VCVCVWIGEWGRGVVDRGYGTKETCAMQCRTDPTSLQRHAAL
jgi:hypothetical protein